MFFYFFFLKKFFFSKFFFSTEVFFFFNRGFFFFQQRFFFFFQQRFFFLFNRGFFFQSEVFFFFFNSFFFFQQGFFFFQQRFFFLQRFFFFFKTAGTHVYNPHLPDIRSTSSNVCKAGALVPSPPCLGEGPHGWVPVDTHSTPVLTSVRRLWVAYVLYEPNDSQENAQPAHGSGARVQDHDPETSQPAQTTAQWSHWHRSWLLQSRYRHQSVTTTRCS